MNFKTFVFSPFQENTFVLYDETGECVVIDPGNFSPNENEELDIFFKDNNLKLVHIINTHNHLDHIFGARYLVDKYGVDIACHKEELFWIDGFKDACSGYGLNVDYDIPQPSKLIADGDIISFGNTELQAIHVPGHSAGSLAFYNKKEAMLFCGDVLFQGSIGRHDLPGGNYQQLITGIRQKLFVLPIETRVFPGHGPETSIGEEKRTNPFFN